MLIYLWQICQKIRNKPICLNLALGHSQPKTVLKFCAIHIHRRVRRNKKHSASKPILKDKFSEVNFLKPNVVQCVNKEVNNECS